MLLPGREVLKLFVFLGIPRCLSPVDNIFKFSQKFMRGVAQSRNMSLGSLEKNPPPSMHYKARCEKYPGSDIIRFKVPDGLVPWDKPFPNYKPIEYTAQAVLDMPPWADISDIKGSDKIKFNEVDGNVDRQSFHGAYHIQDGLPLNPVGRTGITGRGRLGRWGPNHAADPVVTRWKRNDGEEIKHKITGKKILQFIAIKRSDSGEWALPGGMRSPGENISATLKREFGEETMNSLEAENNEKLRIKMQVEKLFKHGSEIYSGYVDDPRNTDNAWMETVACNFHDESGGSVAKFKLHAGDDAVGVEWKDVDSSLKLYASHTEFLKLTAEHLGAHW